MPGTVAGASSGRGCSAGPVASLGLGPARPEGRWGARGCAAAGAASGRAAAVPESARAGPGPALAAPPGSGAGTAGAGAAGRIAGAVGSGTPPVSTTASGSSARADSVTSPARTGLAAWTTPAAARSTSSTAGDARSAGALDGTGAPAGIEAPATTTVPGRMLKTGDNSPELSPPEPGGSSVGAAGAAAMESAGPGLPESSSFGAPVAAPALVAERVSHTAAAAPASSTGRSRREARPERRSFFTCNTPQVRRSNRDEKFGNFRHRSHTRNRKSRAAARISQYDQLAYYFAAS